MSQLKISNIFLLLLISFWVFGCETTPSKELADIDNVITEKQKKEALAQAKAAEAAKLAQQSENQVPVATEPASKTIS